MDSWSNDIFFGNYIQASLVTVDSVTSNNEATMTANDNSREANDNNAITLFLQNASWDDDMNDNDFCEETKKYFMNFGKRIIIA